MPTQNFSIFKPEMKGTAGVDILRPVINIRTDAAFAVDLNFISLQRVNENEINLYIVRNEVETRVVKLKGYNPAVDKISTAQGDFTLQEIFNHGHDAPFYKQARINCQVQRNCK